MGGVLTELVAWLHHGHDATMGSVPGTKNCFQFEPASIVLLYSVGELWLKMQLFFFSAKLRLFL